MDAEKLRYNYQLSTIQVDLLTYTCRTYGVAQLNVFLVKADCCPNPTSNHAVYIM